MSNDDILTQADLAVYEAEPGTQLTHAGACIRAIASIGGDPATVGELAEIVRLAARQQNVTAMALRVLAKLPEPPAWEN